MHDSFDEITSEEFATLMNEFIDREDPDAISTIALDEAAHEQLAQMGRMRIVLTGQIQDGQIIFDSMANAPILTSGNEVIIGGLHLVVDLRKEALTDS